MDRICPQKFKVDRQGSEEYLGSSGRVTPETPGFSEVAADPPVRPTTPINPRMVPRTAFR